MGHVAEALVAAKALGCPIQSDMLAVMLPMLEQSNQFYGGTFQHLTEEHKGMWRTILADGQISPGMSLEALAVLCCSSLVCKPMSNHASGKGPRDEQR